MSEERLMILKMVKDGDITVEEAAKLLETIEKTNVLKEQKEDNEEEANKGQGKFFRLKITDEASGKVKAKIRIPLNMMGIGAKFGAHFAPQIEGLENEKLMQAVKNGEVGKIIDVFDEEDGEHVEIYIE